MNVVPSHKILQQACENMPLFPLPRVVLFPGTLLRLHVFEPRYVQLLQDVQEEQGIFAIPMICMKQLQFSTPELHPVAGFGKVVYCDELPENRYNIVLLGLGRINIQEELKSDRMYRMVCGKLLSEENENFDVVPLQQLLTQIIMKNPSLSETLNVLLHEGLPVRTFLNAVAQIILRSAEEKQLYLEVEQAREQGEMLSEKLAEVLLEGISIQE